MGRGKVVVERIDNNMKRQVSFGKRVKGLMKKATELSVLCDADVALIIFSGDGKLYSYGNADGTKSTLERYRQFHSNGILERGDDEHGTQVRDYHSMAKLQTKWHSLYLKQRHLLGEDIASLSLKRLLHLEKQLEGTISKAKQCKINKMQEDMESWRNTVRDLQHQNTMLKQKVKLEKEMPHGNHYGR